MKRFFKILLFILLSQNRLSGQVLNIKEIVQEQNQWCWAAVSECILDYYNCSMDQCEIAEYTRKVATWHNFGTENCCVNVSSGCNYWNYNWGTAGSIQDILITLGKIQNSGTPNPLDIGRIQTEINNCRPFIIRWGWTAGGGHFLVGYGISDKSIYYMDPWIGEGMKIANYDWLVSNETHTWSHTNLITTNPALPKAFKPYGDTIMIQNPSDKIYRVDPIDRATSYFWSLNPSFAGIINGNSNAVTINFEDSYIGPVTVSVRGQSNCIFGEKNSLVVLINPQAPVISLTNNILSSNYDEGNQWYFNQKIIANANDQTYKPLRNGEYYCVVTVNSCCSLPSNIISYYSTDIRKQEFNDKIRISPNPVNNILRIQVNYSFNWNYKVEIYNENGYLEYSEILDRNIIEFSIDLSQYPSGIYLLRIYDRSSSFQTKFIKI